MRREIDVGVIGGGPAGLAAAIAARQSGFSAALFDAVRPPVDKACGEGLMPDGLAALRRLGVEMPEGAGVPFSGIRFVEAGRAVEASFPQGHGLGIRRTLLHAILAEHAAQAGVALHWGTPVRALIGDSLYVDGAVFRCRWIVGADGHNSRVRRWAGLDGGEPAPRRFASRRHYLREPWTQATEVHWADPGQAYVTPIGPRRVCVALICRDTGPRLEDLPRLFPDLGRRLEGSEAVSNVRGAVTVSRGLRRVTHGRVALIGDASGSVDAITGEGLCLAFRQAVALGEALRRDDLALYEDEHARIRRLPALMARLMLLLDRHPRLRRRVLAAFRAEPALFSRLLGIHTGALSPAALGVGGTLSLGWRVVTA
jgi:menaquinone-9 beta-reductase